MQPDRLGGRYTTLARERPSEAVLAKLLLGRIGNRRVSTMRVGQTLLVGYNHQVPAEVFG